MINDEKYCITYQNIERKKLWSKGNEPVKTTKNAEIYQTIMV